MITITITINTTDDVQGIKEAIAVDMEKYGETVRVINITEDEDQLTMNDKKGRTHNDRQQH